MIKNKKKTVVIDDSIEKLPAPMSFDTYNELKKFIEREKERMHREYCIAANLTYKHDYDGHDYGIKLSKTSLPDSVRDYMWDNYRRSIVYYTNMEKQLKYAAMMSNTCGYISKNKI